MKCQKCEKEFKEDFLQESHDIPCYLFDGDKRKTKKQKADKYGRHWLCKDCHQKYESLILTACLKFVGEELVDDEERVFWIKELSKQPENLKLELRKIAEKIKEEFFDG